MNPAPPPFCAKGPHKSIRRTTTNGIRTSHLSVIITPLKLCFNQIAKLNSVCRGATEFRELHALCRQQKSHALCHCSRRSFSLWCLVSCPIREVGFGPSQGSEQSGLARGASYAWAVSSSVLSNFPRRSSSLRSRSSTGAGAACSGRRGLPAGRPNSPRAPFTGIGLLIWNRAS